MNDEMEPTVLRLRLLMSAIRLVSAIPVLCERRELLFIRRLASILSVLISKNMNILCFHVKVPYFKTYNQISRQPKQPYNDNTDTSTIRLR